MSADLDAIISAAAAGIDSGGSDGGDTGDTGGTDTGTDSGGDAADLSTADAADAGTDAGAEGAEDASGPAAEPDPARSADDLAFDAELAELGLAAPKPGQRDNRIPYSRIRKIVANAKTKWSEKLKGDHTVELTARETQIKELNDLKATYDRAEKAIASDGDNYIAYLARTFPQQYGKYVQNAKGAEKAVETPQEPQPDIKYDDGSLGYSPQQFAKLREYDRAESARVAEERATKQFNERFGPIEKEYRASQQTQQDIQRVRGDIGKLRDQWGEELIDNPDVQKAIVAHLDANPKATLVQAARAVAMERISADRTKMRAELLKELQGAPRAAAKAPAAPNRSDTTNTESIDDIIGAAARALR